jgi:hypothetical protein
MYRFVSLKMTTYYQKQNDNINMDSTIGGSMNDRISFSMPFPSAFFFSYLNSHIEIDIRLRTKHYNKRNDFNDNFPVVNFPLIYSNIPVAPACGVYIS